MNASRNQRRFFCSIDAKCTSSGPKCTAPPSSCGPSWVICVVLSWRLMESQGHARREGARLCLTTCGGDGPDAARPGHTNLVRFKSSLLYTYIFGIFNDPFPSIGEATRTKLPAGEKPALEGHNIKKRGPPGYRMQYGKRYERRRESPEKLNFDKMEFSYTS